jgi:CheY-like chemotaxis protein
VQLRRPGDRARVVCVDDEPTILAALQVMLAPDYDAHFAPSGAAGLELLAKLPPVDVVVSDMRMPAMSGAQFLAQVAAQYPTTVRILLTGANDMDAAVDAVNTGNLFRFLLKPSRKDTLGAALTAGVAHHRLLLSERDLLQRTLVGSIRALTGLLGIADPVAFGRVDRLKHLAVSVAQQLDIKDIWPIEYAALVCQIGNISLPASTSQKLYAGSATSVQERIQIDAAAKLAPGIVRQIPRLEPVTRILEDLAVGHGSEHKGVSAEARILRLVLGYEAMERTSKDLPSALAKLQVRRAEYDADAFNALLHVLGAAPAPVKDDRLLAVEQLRAGMVTAAELRSASGVLVIPAGVEISEGLVARLRNFPAGYLASRIAVKSPNAA